VRLPRALPLLECRRVCRKAIRTGALQFGPGDGGFVSRQSTDRGATK
jgi:hypothetical protein